MATGMTTMAEGLQKVLADLTNTMTAPDADLQFLQAVQNAIVTRMKAGIGNTPGGGAGGPQPGGGMGQPPMGGPGGPGGPGGLPGAMGQMAWGGGSPMGPPGVPGVRSMPNMPNVDELRRILQGQAGG
jgi:hypothetical protein